MKTNHLLLGALMLFSQFSFAGTEGGGGGSMVYIDGSWTLSDFFGPYRVEGQQYRLTGQPKAAMEEILQKISVHNSEVTPGRTLDAMGRFFIENAEYRFVKKLPCDVSAIDVQYGCTKNKVTYIIEKLFKKLSNEDRMLALLHERLHTLNYDHGTIQPYVLAAKKIISGTLDEAAKSDRELLATVKNVQLKICESEFTRGCRPLNFWEQDELEYISPSSRDLSYQVKVGANFIFLKDIELGLDTTVKLSPRCELNYYGKAQGYKVIRKNKTMAVSRARQFRRFRQYTERIGLGEEFSITCTVTKMRISFDDFLTQMTGTLKYDVKSSVVEI